MAKARGIQIHGPGDLVKLTNGPGRLCEAFDITRARDNGSDLTSPTSRLWIGDDGYSPKGIQTTPRIGITKAAEMPLRYVLAASPFLSKKIPAKR
jgi:DNA-3-methyladenine glycosylase